MINPENPEYSKEFLPKLKESYIKALEKIVPYDDEESMDIKRTIEWLQKTEHVHKPHNMEQHLGVLTFVISPDHKSTFLLDHKKAKAWLPPGGHVDSSLNLQEAVDLEIKEELKTEAKFFDTNPYFHTRTLTQGLNANHTDVTFWFILEGNPDEHYEVQEKEASGSKWSDIEEILSDKNYSHLHRGLKKMQGILIKKQE